MNITIDPNLKNITPHFKMLTMTAEVEVLPSDVIDAEIKRVEEKIDSLYEISDVIQIPRILDARNAYKAYGKDPSRYRLAAESLFRRLSKGNQLYRINALVDLGNLLSIETEMSVAVLDLDEIKGDVLVRLGKEEDVYEGIGRGAINISNIPLYADEIGPFGSTTSDTMRTMIKNSTKRILLFVINFSEHDILQDAKQLAEKYLKEYANATCITSDILETELNI